MKKRSMLGILGYVCFLIGCQNTVDQQETMENKKIQLTVLAGQSTSDAGIEDMITEAVSERFPDVELEWECVDWGTEFEDCMRARLSSGSIPDIIIGKAQNVIPYAQMGIIEELHLSGWQTLEEAALDQVMFDGKLYGIPYTAWYQGVIYNKDIFEAYSLSVPETNEELKATVAFLEEQGITAFAAHFRESWKAGNLLMQLMINQIFQEESDWGNRFRAKEISFCDSSDIRWCMEELRYIYEHSFEDSLQLEQAECDRRFDEGDAAMYPTGCWSLQFVNQSQKKVNYGIFPYPTQKESRLIRETNLTIMKSSYSEHGKLLDEILEFLLQNDQMMKEIVEFTQSFSVNTEMEISGCACIQESIAAYQTDKRIVEAATGNRQLVWDYQNDVAEQLLRWLKNEITLETVLLYADEQRQNSKYILK